MRRRIPAPRYLVNKEGGISSGYPPLASQKNQKCRGSNLAHGNGLQDYALGSNKFVDSKRHRDVSARAGNVKGNSGFLLSPQANQAVQKGLGAGLVDAPTEPKLSLSHFDPSFLGTVSEKIY